MKKKFLDSLEGRIFKILPLYEQKMRGEESYVEVCLDSLRIELTGAISTFEELGENPDYISILNTVNYLAENDVTTVVCKREVFKMLDRLKRIRAEVKDVSSNA